MVLLPCLLMRHRLSTGPHHHVIPILIVGPVVCVQRQLVCKAAVYMCPRVAVCRSCPEVCFRKLCDGFKNKYLARARCSHCSCDWQFYALFFNALPKLLTIATMFVFGKRTGAAASVERRRRKPDRAISPEWLARGSASPLVARTHPDFVAISRIISSLFVFVKECACARRPGLPQACRSG